MSNHQKDLHSDMYRLILSMYPNMDDIRHYEPLSCLINLTRMDMLIQLYIANCSMEYGLIANYCLRVDQEIAS